MGYVEMVPIATAFIGTTIAAIWDLKTTEVPDPLPYVMIAIGILFFVYQSIITGSFAPITSSMAYGIGFLLFGALMYYAGQWGGADSLLIGAIGFLLPTIPQGFAHTNFPFMISFFMNMFIVGAIYMLIYAFLFSLRNRKIFSHLVNDIKSNSKTILTLFIGIELLFYVAGLKLTQTFHGSIEPIRAFYLSLYPLITVSIFYIVWKFAKSVETNGFRTRIPIAKLKVGDMLMNEKKLVGVTKEQIMKLKKSGKHEVEIKLGIPFAVAFPIAILVTLYYGDLIFHILNLF